jgi:hypothetical protein
MFVCYLLDKICFKAVDRKTLQQETTTCCPQSYDILPSPSLLYLPPLLLPRLRERVFFCFRFWLYICTCQKLTKIIAEILVQNAEDPRQRHSPRKKNNLTAWTHFSLSSLTSEVKKIYLWALWKETSTPSCSQRHRSLAISKSAKTS